MRIDNPYLLAKMFKNTYKSGFSPVRQDLSGKFGCPVLSGQKTHIPSPVEPYFKATLINFTSLPSLSKPYLILLLRIRYLIISRKKSLRKSKNLLITNDIDTLLLLEFSWTSVFNVLC